MHKHFLIFICLLAAATLESQAQVFYYLKADGFVVLEKDSADFIRVINRKDPKTKLYPIMDYFKSGALKARGSSASNIDIQYTGQVISYYENGKRKQIVNYENGYTIGEIFEYYPNGMLYKVFELVSDGYNNRVIKLKQANDTTGKATVMDGNGYYTEYNDDFTNIEAEGNIKNFTWDGPVKGLIKAYGISYNEVYQDGKLLAGRAKDSAGNVYTYRKEYNAPDLKDTGISFDNYILDGLRTIKAKSKQNIKRPVRVRFTVEDNGRLSNIYLPESLGPEIDAQIRKLFIASPPWIPGIKKGVPVKTVLSGTF